MLVYAGCRGYRSKTVKAVVCTLKGLLQYAIKVKRKSKRLGTHPDSFQCLASEDLHRVKRRSDAQRLDRTTRLSLCIQEKPSVTNRFFSGRTEPHYSSLKSGHIFFEWGETCAFNLDTKALVATEETSHAEKAVLQICGRSEMGRGSGDGRFCSARMEAGSWECIRASHDMWQVARSQGGRRQAVT